MGLVASPTSVPTQESATMAALTCCTVMVLPLIFRVAPSSILPTKPPAVLPLVATSMMRLPLTFSVAFPVMLPTRPPTLFFVVLNVGRVGVLTVRVPFRLSQKKPWPPKG